MRISDRKLVQLIENPEGNQLVIVDESSGEEVTIAHEEYPAFVVALNRLHGSMTDD